MDNDLETMTPAQLAAEVRKLRAAIRQHRDATGHDLCWHQPDLWALLPEGTAHVPVVPEWPAFLRGCIRYRQHGDGILKCNVCVLDTNATGLVFWQRFGAKLLEYDWRTLQLHTKTSPLD